MSHTENKGKKMSFDQYHTKLSQKKPNVKHNAIKPNMKPLYSNNTHASHNNNLLPSNNSSNQPQKHLKQHPPIVYTRTQYQEQISQHRQLNRNSSKQSNNESISFPVSHQENSQNLQQIDPSSIKKIDLIFEKQPQQVQNKLRMLLLNYNAVMQYNQEDDKFQVDLLLPFESVQQQQAFVQKFHKTRQNIKQKIQKGKQLQQQKNQSNQQESQYKNQQQLNQNLDQENGQGNHNYRIQEENSLQHQELAINNYNEKAKQQFSIDYTGNKKDEDQKQNSQIDFYQLSLSIDQSIKKAMNMIIKPKLVLDERKENHFQESSLKRDDPQIKMQYDQLQTNKTGQTSKLQQKQMRLQNDYNQNNFSQDHDNNLERQNQYQETQFYSQAEQQSISSCDHPSKPHSINYNTNHAYLSNHFHNQQTLPNNNPLLPHSVKLNHYKMSNINSNQILIQDQFTQNQQYQSYKKSHQSYNQTQFQESSLSDHSNQDFTMIQETEEEHQQETSISPRQYQLFLKNKLNSIHKNPSNKDPLIISSQSRTVSSFKKDYDQFLKKNRTKIQKLYLRIGNHINKSQRRTQKGINFSSQKKKANNEVLIIQDPNQSFYNKSHEGMLEDFRKRIILENESMSSQDKVRYFRYLAKNAKKLYIDYIKNQGSKIQT